MSEVVARNSHAVAVAYDEEDIRAGALKMSEALGAAGVEFTPDSVVGLLGATILALRGPMGCPSDAAKKMVLTILEVIDSLQKVQDADTARAPYIKALVQ